MKTILDYLELNSHKYSNKNIFVSNNESITYREFVLKSKRLGSSLLEYNNEPIVIFMDKSISLLISMIGVIYSGNYYTIIDNKMPLERVNLILDVLHPKAIICHEKDESKISGNVITYESIINKRISTKLDNVRDKIIDTNPMYILFTSGSTGIPKGVVVSHKAVISYCTWFTSCFGINYKTIFGSQTPFYFSMSVSDVFGTMMAGSTLCLIPKMYFSFPIKLLEFLNDNKVNTIYWVPSALAIVSSLDALKDFKLKYIKKVLFAGEVMPTKQLNYWIKHLSKRVLFANLFGPTETTDICTYYIVDRKFNDGESLPIGTNCDNCDVMIINDNKLVSKGEVGELYVRGSFLANGYFNNPTKTNEVFVQNPLQNSYPEIVYRTGDLVKLNKNNELIYVSRKDFQIKHMGYRIELGEIENRINTIDHINTCVCAYTNDHIVLYYQGNIEIPELVKNINTKLPDYMRPNKINKIDRMIYNMNGKIDRNYFMNLSKGE